MASVYEDIQALFGKESQPETGVDDVSKEMIRHWCEAMEDGNPLYTDEGYAQKSKHGGIISPPQMVQAWSFGPLWPNGQEIEYRHPELLPKKEKLAPYEMAMRRLDQAGFTAVVVTRTTLEFHRPLFPGDRVTRRIKVADITPEKKTGLGSGHFLTMSFIYTNQKGELICNQSLTVLKFKPPQ